VKLGSNTLDGVDLVVLAAVLAVPFLFALALPRLADTTSGGSEGVAIIAAVTLMEVPLALLAVWAVRRRGEPLSVIGIVRPSPMWICAALVVLAGAAWLTWQRHTGAWAGAVSASGAGGGAYTTPQRIALVALGVPQIYLQELLYRGFAIAWLERITGSVVAAVVISAAAFAIAHITSLGGNLAVSLLAVFITGVVLGILYTTTRDLMPVFLIHWAWVAWLAVGLSTHVDQRAAIVSS